MNKRILKLFNEAGFHQPEMERLGIEHKFEKFAELIVRECGKVAMSGVVDGYVMRDLEVALKQHFGVDE